MIPTLIHRHIAWGTKERRRQKHTKTDRQTCTHTYTFEHTRGNRYRIEMVFMHLSWSKGKSQDKLKDQVLSFHPGVPEIELRLSGWEVGDVTH